MSMYKTFQTDPELESKGIWIDYGDFKVLLGSASSSNRKYTSYAEKALKPVRKALQADALSPERIQKIMADVYANTLILSWMTNVKNAEGETTEVHGIESPNGEILPFNYENIMSTLIALPHLFIDLQEQANLISNFRKAELEKESGN
jgi:hypothetical protein